MIDPERLIEAGILDSYTDPVAALHIEAALDWLQQNTTIQFDKDEGSTIVALPACAKLFCVKFAEAMRRTIGVSSQSSEGLSLSFDANTDMDSTIKALAKALLGSQYLKSQVRVTPARRRW